MSSCPGCGLANHDGLCAVCRGDEEAARAQGLPYPWPEECEHPNRYRDDFLGGLHCADCGVELEPGRRPSA